MMSSSCKGRLDFIVSQQYAQSHKVAKGLVADELSEGED